MRLIAEIGNIVAVGISDCNSRNSEIARALPDDMLNVEQKKIKWEGISETIKTTDEKNDKKYKEFIESGNLRAAQEMVYAKAKANGYIVKADFDTKKREDLSVIAKQAGLGDITEKSLTNSLAQFKKEVKAFREKNFSIRLSPTTPQTVHFSQIPLNPKCRMRV